MSNEALAPLLRGIGTTVILMATLIAFFIARREADTAKTLNPTPGIEARESTRQTGNRVEPDQESVAEEILENRWFEWLGFTGTAIIAGSFYTEYFARKAKAVDGGRRRY